MPALSPVRQNGALLAILLFVQLLLIALSVRGERGSTVLELAAMRVTRPLVSAAGTVAGGIRAMVLTARDLSGARAENVELRAEIDRQRAELRRREEDALQNRRLRQLLVMREELFPQSIVAAVISAAITDKERMIVIDRGTEDAVHPDLPVVAWGGAVGRVVRAGARTAKVRLLTSPNAGVGGAIQRSRVSGAVYGRGRDRMEMRFVPRYQDVVIGDRVVTSGVDGVFPAGLGVGRVVFVGETEAEISKTILLEPEVDLTRLEEVMVLLEPVGAELLDVETPEDRR